ncbi:MAG: hypothetical protein E5W70_27625 [Mesorhizobium sp.]|uniref:hypothetical protein n=1 Tax=Mesorhizobium sp. TaxID=1871066 RepID=UPI0012298C7E|nr:hypothetical protein [Mesorhizobium sp.]TIT18858.1 MAG: hypothetical protein E5W70_27625 [Mesorhizobium sp.]
MTVVTPKFGMSASVLRREDQAFLKGARKAGTIGSTPAALNAVTEALYRAYGIRHIDMPATPARIWGAIEEAKGA